MDSIRKMASIRRIAEIKPITGADRIVAYRVDGWWVIDQKDRYQVGDSVIYCEVDSWLPNSIAPFLSKGKEPREYNGIKGEKLKTIKMKGQLSQGLLLPLSLLEESGVNFQLGTDVSELFGITKWEPPAELIRADAKGLWPHFLRKTDQERIQNCYEDYAKIAQTNNQDEYYQWYLEEKLEGQSFTAYLYNGVFGVCSRNLELKDGDNTFWNNARKYKLEEKLRAHGKNIAVQCEQIGPGIQGNYYGLNEHELIVFDVFDIDTQEYFSVSSRNAFAKAVLEMRIPPFIKSETDSPYDLEYILEQAEGKSKINPEVEREGVIWRLLPGNLRFTFKAISNNYLLGKD